MDNYNEKLENDLLEKMKQKERADKKLLSLEIFIVIIVVALLLVLVLVASFVQMADWLRVVLIVVGLIPFAIGIAYAIRIEQTAGYYKCAKCGHRYVPTYSSVLWAMHINRTRYMRCPRCHEKSWQKKVLSKE